MITWPDKKWLQVSAENAKLRRLVKLAIVVILFLVASLIYTAVRHAQALDRCYIPGESIQLDTEPQPMAPAPVSENVTVITAASLVHWKNRKRWHV